MQQSIQPLYPEKIVKPQREELAGLGFKELKTPEKINNYLQNNKGTILFVINSICGCAARSARPAIKIALQNEKLPQYKATVFAGQDHEATEHLRKVYLAEFLPSSPAVILFKNQRPIFILHRSDIISKEPEILADAIKKAFDEFC
jgi:putative YphP/YqiW family bacilliredoxin